MSDHALANSMFKNMSLQGEYDTHDPEGLYERSKIIEIVAARGIVFALTKSGICAAFSRETKKRICFLNVSDDEVIRSLYYNKYNHSLILVSISASDRIKALKCRTTAVECIERGMPNAGYALFESESLKYPGFVEFDGESRKILTFSAETSIYKVFDMNTYMMLYSISDENILEIKLSTRLLLLIYKTVSGHASYVPLKILSAEDGTVLRTFNYVLCQDRVDFIQLFNESILIKQENENLHVLDARNSTVTEVSRTKFVTPSSLFFLSERQLLVTIRQKKVAVWNLHGDLVTSYENHFLFNTNNMSTTNVQDLIISYCKTDPEDSVTEEDGSINIVNAVTGECLVKVKAMNDVKAIEALEGVTALFYDEELNEIYTGNRVGLVHVWSN